MTRLTWGAVGERFYEAGVDRGVLFVGNAAGVPWNGLVSVNEAATGGDVTPSYIDGIRYLNDVATEEFEATIEAYTYPDEFEQCDGTVPIKNGLFATQQKRKSFGLAYRSKIGNDVDGLKHGYKLHLVYNVTASPTERNHSSVGDAVEPDNFSWKVTTIPSIVKGYRPTAHFVIDSRDTPQDVLNQIEDVLYGNASGASRLPSIPELVYIFESYDATYFDAGSPIEPMFAVFDAGSYNEVETSMVDGGSP